VNAVIALLVICHHRVLVKGRNGQRVVQQFCLYTVQRDALEKGTCTVNTGRLNGRWLALCHHRRSRGLQVV